MKIDRYSPASLKIKERTRLTLPGSSKETFHVVLGLEGTPLTFKVGDSVGIYPHNDPILVHRWLQALKVTGQEIIQDPRSSLPFTFKEFLAKKVNLSRLTSGIVALFNPSLLSDKVALVAYCQTHEPLDLFNAFPSSSLDLQALCNTLAPLLPRFYSVASSLKAHPTEVHLTVSLSSYLHNGETRYGVASYFLSHLAEIETTPIPTYVQPSPHFTLPQDPNASLLMIGPGTGIAPFRGFLQERRAHAAPGKNWLFFGERNAKTDFFYAPFWKELEESSLLRLTTAFSRDQEHKIYVQHKLLEHAKEVWQWLQEGAFLYVCGEADPMAKEVEQILVTVAQQEGNLTLDEARAYLRHLRSTKRYLTDVY